MKVTIIKNKNGILESLEDKIKSGYEEENRAYTLEFEFPDFLEEYNKIIEFNFDGNKEYDLIQDNEYILKNNVTKYSFIPCQIVFTKEEDEHTRVFKTNIFYLDFSESINADIEIDPESEDVKLLNTLIESVNLTIEEVSTLKDEVTLLAEETRLKGEYAQMQGDYAKEQGDSAKEEVDKIETMLEGGELNGATFIPSVSDDGDISWTNDKDLPNPTTKNIKGDTGLTPDISVGSTTTLAPGTNAYVEILGTKENPIINFYIPRGDNGRIEFRLVNELPVVGETGIIYLVPEEDPEVQNRYDEYIWINNAWEKFGSASIDIDLDKYYTKEEIATILLDYVTNSSLATTLANYVLKQELTTTLSGYETKQELTTTLLDYVTQTDLTTELADYVKNTDYATSTTGGVVKTNGSYAIVTANNGNVQTQVKTYSDYENLSNNAFIGKGTLENFVAGRNLETANNKVTEINENNTNTEYPSAKAVYNSIKDFSTEEELLSENPTENVEGTELEIDNTIDSRIKLNKLGGNTNQDGEPTPDTPVNVDVVTGNNKVVVQGKNLIDNTNLNYLYSNVNPIENMLSSISTGIRYSTTRTSGTPFVLYGLLDMKKYVGKTIRMKADFSNASIRLVKMNADGTIRNIIVETSNTGNTISYTIPSNLDEVQHYLGYSLVIKAENTQVTDFTNLILTIDNEDMSYIPYTSQKYPINLGTLELCKIGDYQDYLYKNNGKWFKYKAIGKLELAIADMNLSENYPGWREQIQLYEDLGSMASGGSLSNYTSYLTNISSANSGIQVNFNSATNPQLFLSRTYFGMDHTTPYWQQNYPDLVFTLYYKIKTPTEEEITDTTLLSQLEDFYNAKTLQEKTIISQENEELPFILDLDYFTNSIAGNIAGTNYNVDILIADIEKALEEINGESVGG